MLPFPFFDQWLLSCISEFTPIETNFCWQWRTIWTKNSSIIVKFILKNVKDLGVPLKQKTRIFFRNAFIKQTYSNILFKYIFIYRLSSHDHNELKKTSSPYELFQHNLYLFVVSLSGLGACNVSTKTKRYKHKILQY